MDPVALSVAALQAGVALAVIFVVPGLALGPIIAPGASTPLGRIGRAVGASLLTTSIGCTVLAWLGILAPASTIVLLLAVSGLCHARPATLDPSRPATVPTRHPVVARGGCGGRSSLRCWS